MDNNVRVPIMRMSTFEGCIRNNDDNNIVLKCQLKRDIKGQAN